MTRTDLKTLSKSLSYLLRHKPEALGLTMDPQGWVAVDQIVARMPNPISRAEIEAVVRTSAKQRCALSADGARIRANQGHSIPVDLGLPACTPPEVLYHGTARARLPAIFAEGLTRQARHHVHLSSDAETALQVGQRHGQPVVLTIAAGAMHRAGHTFYLSANGVWLCDAVVPEFLDSGGLPPR